MHNTKTQTNEFKWSFSDWWEFGGKSKALQKMNPIRFNYIKQYIEKFYQNTTNLKILDVGCGGGLLTELLCKISKNINGIDISEECINIAQKHSEESNLEINYSTQTIENLIQKNEKFDIIVSMETIEHVEDWEGFITNCCSLLNKNGMLFISTINKNIKSFIYAIAFAEYILNIVPKQTHKWNLFKKPSEINKILIKNNTNIINISGIKFDYINFKCSISNDIDINYIICAIKN